MEFLTNIRDWWKGLGGGTRALVIGGGLMTALALGLFVYLSPTEGMLPIGPEMPPEEIKAVRDRLTTLGINNTLDKRGVNVLVPESRLAEAKVGLAAEGLPTRTGRGLESFEESSFGATPFQNAVNYQRALQNELARAINQVESVAAARVLIARPEPTPFVRPERAPTASVILRMKPGANLGKPAANSIVSLVAHAVDGLKPENVTIIDSSGRMLSDPYAANKDDLPGEMVDYRKDLEQYLAKKAQAMISKVVGEGRVVVTVNADLNYQKAKEKQKKYSADEKVVIAERTTNDKTSSTSGARGPVGVASNTAARPGGGSGSGSGSSNSETIGTDYLPSVTEREIEDKMGAVTRLTVAAVVDLSPQATAEGAATSTEPVMPLDKVQDIIRQAVGFKQGRDELTVTNVKLNVPVPTIPEIDEETPRIKRMQEYVSLARNISLAFAAVVGFAILPLALLRRSRPAAKPVEAPPAPPTAEQLATAARERRRQQLERLAELTRTKTETVSDVFNILVSK